MGLTKSLSIFQGKKVLVTGDTGFKGSWLSYWLHTLGAEVHGFAQPPLHEKDHFTLLKLDTLIQHTDGDVRDQDALQTVVNTVEPEFIFHLAAQSLVRRSYQEPRYTFETNILGAVNLFEAIRESSSLRALVCITSDKCYKNHNWEWGYRETDELGGRDPYSASKASVELVFHAYQESFFSQSAELGVATARAGNVIGGGDWSDDRLVPDCIRSLQDGKPLEIRNPKSTRPWQHVLEPLSGYLSLASQLYEHPQNYASSFNFGPRELAASTVKDVAEKMLEYWGEGELRNVSEQDAPHEESLLQLDCSRAGIELGWQAKWNFEKTMKETVRWYKEVHQGRPASEITKEQIETYVSD